MNTKTQEITPQEYLHQKGIQFREKNGELQFQCPFSVECHTSKHAGHCYMCAETGQYDCKTCGQKGNLLTLMKYFNDDYKSQQIKPVIGKEKKRKSVVEEPTTVCEAEVDKYAAALPQTVLDWLINERGISLNVIKTRKLGYGNFYDKNWITIPVAVGDGYFIKLRKNPFDDGNSTKHSVFPKGNSVALYGKDNLKNNDDYVIICEGELDMMVLESNGLLAVTSTGGAATFKDEWIREFEGINEIIVCLDRDKSGQEGALKISENLGSALEDSKVFQVVLPEETGDKGDVTDFFVKLHKSVDDFMALKQLYVPTDDSCRFAKLPLPKRPITAEKWVSVINKNFPAFLFAAELGLSVIAQILIKDVTNPFAVILLDVPSSGKTITINFFDGIEELVYSSDKFSAASFVSHSANVNREKLKQVDLLPRVRYKMFLIRDFASIFAQREEDLKNSLGILTRVLDGEGFESDSGVHGSRGYKGEYLFMILGASTPIPPRVWKIMGNLGSRLFFLHLNSPDKNEDQLALQLQDRSYKVKEKICKKATHDLLKTLWAEYPEGVEWNHSNEDPELLKIIGRCAKLLSKLRGTINVWREKGLGGDEYSYTKPTIEKPDRINQLLYNLARGHTLAFGRKNLTKPDIRVVIELVFDSADIVRSQLFQLLLSYDGKISTSDIEKELNCSKPTALKEMKALGVLGICDLEEDEPGMIGRAESQIVLKQEFMWFLSDECKEVLANTTPY
ncbi:toprim domain-containing protein [Candidatus Peregrinibacteria bacterium]|jgi:hypothetical protein|nr:toprim domain-containing protein [Candidatus Peregrinibacteria bacterium]MBT4055602.1 toprim domain-containing protein [Candidatus Peregrinibacteria bacterium]